MRLTLGFVAETLLGGAATELNRVAVSHCVVDSRQAQPGALFFAFRGEAVDGQAYVADAIGRGAVGAVVRREGAYAVGGPLPVEGGWAIPVPDVLVALQELARAWRQQVSPRVVGVTGSVGKTLTRGVLAAVLGRRYRVLQSERNYNNEIGLPLSVLSLTPEHDYAVLEMGMYALGEIADLAEICRPVVGVVTNVGPTHLERLGSLEAIAEAKSELVAALPADGLAVLNGDDDRARAMSDLAPGRVVTYGLKPGRTFQADDVRMLGPDGVEFTVKFDGGARRLTAPLPGRHSVYACLAAVAVGRAEGMSWADIEQGLQVSGGGSRLRIIEAGGMTILDDTYNAAPASVLAALEVLGETPGRRVAVLGDMLELGSYSEAGHREVGRAVPASADVLVCVGPLAGWFAEEASRRMAPEAVVRFRSTEEALSLVPSLLRPGDSVLVKGSRGLRLERLCQALVQGQDSDAF